MRFAAQHRHRAASSLHAAPALWATAAASPTTAAATAFLVRGSRDRGAPAVGDGKVKLKDKVRDAQQKGFPREGALC